MTDRPNQDDNVTFEETQAGDIDVGEVQWHSSDPDGGGPDVGMLVRLDASQFLWAGEITRHDWEEAGEDAAAVGADDSGWWAIFYEENGGRKTVLGKFVDPETAREFIDKLALIIKPPARPAAVEDGPGEWRTINDGAPKDGTHVLVSFDGTSTPPTVAHWFGPPPLPGLRAGAWYLSVQQLEGPSINPTHWRKLPAPPSPTEGEAQ